MMNSPEVGFSAEITLLRTMSGGKDRPNVMVMSRQPSVDRIVGQLTAVCQSPIQVCRFPGVLNLTSVVSGTLVLGDIDQLSIGQQISLSDWLWCHRTDVQIVSVTRAAMSELIAEGRFLEGLFYRLNTIVLRSVDGHDFNATW